MLNLFTTIEYGLPADAALEALTINPAKIFGVAEQLGSLEGGKIANILVTDGDIFDEKTSIKYLFIDGKKMEIKEKKKATSKAKGEGEEPSVDVSGEWEMTVSTSMGDQLAIVIFEQSGADLTGTFEVEDEVSDIASGEISGNNIEFTVLVPVVDPPIEIVFIGEVEGDKMSGTVDLSAMQMGTADWTAIKP